jgi:hypothetical protein
LHISECIYDKLIGDPKKVQPLYVDENEKEYPPQFPFFPERVYIEHACGDERGNLGVINENNNELPHTGYMKKRFSKKSKGHHIGCEPNKVDNLQNK